MGPGPTVFSMQTHCRGPNQSDHLGKAKRRYLLLEKYTKMTYSSCDFAKSEKSGNGITELKY